MPSPRLEPRIDAVDREALHKYFWRKSNNRHRITVSVHGLAEEMGIGEDHMGRIIIQMVKQGRMLKVGRSSAGIILSIRDPDAAVYPWK